jgi:CDP-2,3-bis-(O-geranylgeranyl)-sn-glycerol synthase
MEHIHGLVIVKLLVLLATANGTPVLARWILKDWADAPLDGGWRLSDGRPVLGTSKTIRGLVCAIVATALAALLLGFPATIGFIVGATAMLGDLISSFLKRRLGLPASAMALGLDQIPESLLPLIALWPILALTLADAVVILAAFFTGELLLSRLLYRLHVRDRPY